MRNHYTLPFCSILLCILLSSCTKAIYYAPAPISDVGVTHKGDLVASVAKVTVANGIDRKDQSGIGQLDVSLAYSPFDNFGAYFKSVGYKERFTNSKLIYGLDPVIHAIPIVLRESKTFYFSQSMSEFGAGYYKHFNSTNFELYGFHAYGAIRFGSKNSDIVRADMKKTGVKSALTFKHGNIGGGFALSVSKMNYLNIETQYQSKEDEPSHYLLDHQNHVLFETGFNLNYNVKFVQLRLALGLAQSNDREFEMHHSASSIGLVFNIDDIFKTTHSNK